MNSQVSHKQGDGRKVKFELFPLSLNILLTKLCKSGHGIRVMEN